MSESINPKFIIVHVPKCSGSSMRRAFFEALTPERVLLDYGDRPADPESLINLDFDRFLDESRRSDRSGFSNVEAVYGHFHIKKYDWVELTTRITMLREPISRLLSHYHFWTSRRPSKANALWKYVNENKLDIVEFASLPTIRYFYTQTFFRETDMGVFDYVLDFSDYAGEMARLGRCLGMEFPIFSIKENTSPEYATAKRDLENNATLRHELERLLRDDIRFYGSAMSGEGTKR